MADPEVERKQHEVDAEIALIRAELWRIRDRVRGLEGRQDDTDARLAIFVSRFDALIDSIDKEGP